MEITERKIWRYQRYSEAWLTIHYHKKKTNNGQQKTTQKTRLNKMNPTEKQGWTRCSRRISTSCFTSGTSRVTLHRFMPVRGVNYQHCTITYKYVCLKCMKIEIRRKQILDKFSGKCSPGYWCTVCVLSDLHVAFEKRICYSFYHRVLY